LQLNALQGLHGRDQARGVSHTRAAKPKGKPVNHPSLPPPRTGRKWRINSSRERLSITRSASVETIATTWRLASFKVLTSEELRGVGTSEHGEAVRQREGPGAVHDCVAAGVLRSCC
jgi:hypothetical protein